MKSRFLAVPLAAALLLTACQEKKPARIAPPPAATAPTIVAAAPPQPPLPAPPKPDPVAALLDQVEQEYATGQSNYKAGHLEAAKANFDNAVNLLMQGPVDVRSDDRLRAEFDKIVEGVHALELVAIKQGDGFTEQKAEPAPIDETNDVTFPSDPAVTAKAEAELKETRSDFPLVINEFVSGYINFFSNTAKGRNTLINAWQRAGRYKEMIRRVLREEGVPQDLLFLAQAESGFHPLAVSRAGARGMWQFMHYTAPGYGLSRNWWVDDRQDPEKSTRAAARYLKDLYSQFGDWYLAMAAYNSGAGNVQRGVQRTGYADFWELYRRNVLPGETKNYVPIIVAMTIIAKNPLQYGLSEVEVQPPEAADVVTTDYAVDLRLVAEAIDAPLEQLSELNPSLLRLVTPKDRPFGLKLPAGTRETFEANIAAIPKDKRVSWRYHKVAGGDTLGSIAQKYRTTAKAIHQVNNLEGDELAEGAKLIIPVTASKRGMEGALTTYSKRPTRYKVRKGDTVLSVADDFGVPVDRLRRWNRIKGNALRQGRTIVIYKPVAGGAPPEPARKHKKGASAAASRKAGARGAKKTGAPDRSSTR